MGFPIPDDICSWCGKTLADQEHATTMLVYDQATRSRMEVAFYYCGPRCQDDALATIDYTGDDDSIEDSVDDDSETDEDDFDLSDDSEPEVIPAPKKRRLS